MIALGTLRAHPHCACLFDDVPVLFWPTLWWQLNNMIRWMRGANVSGVRFETNAWGFITLRYVVYQPGPNAYRPVERTFRMLIDPSWASDTPACLDADEPAAGLRLILPRMARQDLPKAAEGAFASAPNTSLSFR